MSHYSITITINISIISQFQFQLVSVWFNQFYFDFQQ